MKKTFLLITLFLCLTISYRTNAQSFEEGVNNASVGYGFGNFIQSVFKNYETFDDYTFNSMGPIFLKYEYAVTDKLGVGLNIAYANAKVSYKDNTYNVSPTEVYEETIKWSTMSFLARMNLHFGDMDRFDPYWGVGVGYRTASWKYEDNDPEYDNDVSVKNFFPFGFETTIGARYFFTDNIGVYAEAGLAKAVIQVGVNAKF